MIRRGDIPADFSEQIDELYDRLESCLESGDFDGITPIEREATRLRNLLPEHEHDLYCSVSFLLAECQMSWGNYDIVQEICDQVDELGVAVVELDLYRARALFHTWRFEDAGRLLDRSLLADHPNADFEYYQGLLADFRGDFEAADQWYGRAAESDRETFHRPFRSSPEVTKQMLEKTLASFPRDVRQALENVDIVLSPLPERKIYCALRVDPLVLGIYSGVSLTERDPFSSDPYVPRIDIFQRNIERVCDSEAQYAQELAVTILHEVGHHLGWDEDDLDQRGLA